MSTARRLARELALNALYRADVAKIPFEEALETALGSEALETALEEEAVDSLPERESLVEDAEKFARELAEGAYAYRRTADAEIQQLSQDWRVERQPAVDRNILRLAMYEICCVESIPSVVSVNEAIELAKKYSTEDSGKFVNGVLAAYIRKRGEDARGTANPEQTKE